MMDLKMKSEYRNPKQIQMAEVPNLLLGCEFETLEPSDFGVRSSELTGTVCPLVG
jgi:hypothetical protein